MAKKDFSKININPVYDAIAAATEEPETTAAAAEQPAAETVEAAEAAAPEEEPAEDAQEVAKKHYKPRKTYTAEETLAALENMRTSGRKGVKLPRINLAFTPANYEFIKTMAQVRGQSLTEFVNDMLEEIRIEHADIYEKAMEFRNSI